MVPYVADTRADLTEDIEIIHLFEYREVCGVERPAVDMLLCVETESVDAHIDVIHIGAGQEGRNLLVFRIDIDAVARHLAGLLNFAFITHVG